MKRTITVLKRNIGNIRDKIRKGRNRTEDYFIAYFDILGYKK